jgi:cell division protein FtsQ
MNTMTQPVSKRAWQYKQERVKNVQLVRLRNRITKFLSFVLPVIALVLLGADMLGRSNAFPIKTIEYRGVFKYASQNDVDEAAKLSLNGNFFTVDLFTIQQKVEALPWVQSVSLDRKWPDTIVLNIEEFKPIMRWGGGGWVSTTGVLISAPLDQSYELQNLPKLDGKVSELKSILYKFNQWQYELDALGLSIRTATFSESHSWALTLHGSDLSTFILQLGSTNEDARFNRFVRLFGQDESYFSGVEYIDARYPNGVVLKRKPSVLENQEEPDAEV